MEFDEIEFSSVAARNRLKSISRKVFVDHCEMG